MSSEMRRLIQAAIIWTLLSGCSGSKEPAALAVDSATGQPSQTSATREAHRATGFRELYNAKDFSGESAVYEDEIPPAVMALRCLVRQDDAVARLRNLADKGSLPGQLYALVGLRALDQDEFALRVTPFLSNTTKVRVLGGDVYAEQAASEIASRIRDGLPLKDFLPEMAHLSPGIDHEAFIKTP